MADQTINKSEDEVLLKAIDKRIMKRLLSYFKPYSKYIVIATILTITISALAALRPRLTPIAIDEKIMTKDFPGLQTIVLILLGTLILQGVIQYGMTYLTNWIGQKIIYDLRKKIFDHILTLDLKFFDKNPIGRVVTRVTGDVEVLFEVFLGSCDCLWRYFPDSLDFIFHVLNGFHTGACNTFNSSCSYLRNFCFQEKSKKFLQKN